MPSSELFAASVVKSGTLAANGNRSLAGLFSKLGVDFFYTARFFY
jgi:hypothetical protein